MGTFMGTREREREPLWEHGNTSGNVGTCVEHELVVGIVLGYMGTARMIPCTRWCLDMGTLCVLGNTYIHAEIHYMHHVHRLQPILIKFMFSWKCTTVHCTYGDNMQTTTFRHLSKLLCVHQTRRYVNGRNV